jgi:ATP-binding cassette, subfamily B, heavy metal transporter
LLNFETVKYFSNERHEAMRYDESLTKYVEASVKSQTSLALLNVGQAAIIAIGVASVMLLAAKQRVDGKATVGDFVAVMTYLLQLYIPLNFLGTSYRMIKTNLVDLEQMFTLLDEAKEVEDVPHAEQLQVENGLVEFKHVSFHYDPKVAVLNDVRSRTLVARLMQSCSFFCPPAFIRSEARHRYRLRWSHRRGKIYHYSPLIPLLRYQWWRNFD